MRHQLRKQSLQIQPATHYSILLAPTVQVKLVSNLEIPIDPKKKSSLQAFEGLINLEYVLIGFFFQKNRDVKVLNT